MARMITIDGRLVAFAEVTDVAAPGREAASRRAHSQVGRPAGNAIQRPAGRACHLRQGVEQCLGVRVPRTREQSARIRVLDDPAAIHHGNALGAPGDDAEVVRHQDHRHPQLRAQVVDELKNLALDRHVQGRRRLVGDQQPGLAGQGSGDHRALAHATGQLMRVQASHALRLRHPDQSEHLDGPRRRRLTVRAPVHDDGLGDLPADRHGGVEGARRVLEDHADVVAPDRLHVALRQARQLGSGQPDRAGGDHAASRQQPQN